MGISKTVMPYTGGSQSASIGRPYCGCLKTLVYALLIYLLKTYISAFENARIGTAYASAFKSVGIGCIHIFVNTI